MYRIFIVSTVTNLMSGWRLRFIMRNPQMWGPRVRDLTVLTLLTVNHVQINPRCWWHTPAIGTASG